MEAIGLTLTVAQTILAALDCSDLKELFSRFKHKDELEKLKKTVQTIQSVLLDADAKGVLNQQEKLFVDNLKNALYDADDLLDEFVTLAAQEKQHLHTNPESKGLRKVLKKVRRLFTRFGKLPVAYGMSQGVKKITETLDGIANDASKFSFKVDYQPIRKRRDDTCSYVNQTDIIGREEDTKRVVDILLDPTAEGHIPVLTIVGMGGLGKTALAQLIFEDERIITEFPLRLWTCVNDEGTPELNVDSVLRSILKSDTNETYVDGLIREQLQRKLRKKLNAKKYLLVLDDVWTEKHMEWLKLVEFLKGGQSRSRIVVTTRSRGTATAVGSHGKLTYELEGLSDENSWHLFEMTVGQGIANSSNLVATGRAIVKKCANVPLAIKVIGSLLFGQDEYKWRSIERYRLSEIEKGENDIMQILKFSYYHLTPSLKSCFAYCALFSKDCVIRKEMLISLWIAQGYIEPLDLGQSIENAATEYFMILLRRCFFQNVKKDEYGEIVSCKIHDLMHDVAQEVSRKDICGKVANFNAMSSHSETIRHISYASGSFCTMTKVRTHLFHLYNQRVFAMSAFLANFTCVRALDLSYFKIRFLPDTIGELLHLRYLDISSTPLNMLPESITKLHNLQTLLLDDCEDLIELPEDFSKLVNLRVLDGCNSLSYMPLDMKKLTGLCKLTMFVVGGRSSSSKQGFEELEDLGALNKLKGRLRIDISNDFRYVKEKHGEGAGYLRNKEHLKQISISWQSGADYEGRVQEQEALLEDLQPHYNLRELSMWNYVGERIPSWAREDKIATSFPNLVMIRLHGCKQLQELSWLSKLHFQRRLCGLGSVEWRKVGASICHGDHSFKIFLP